MKVRWDAFLKTNLKMYPGNRYAVISGKCTAGKYLQCQDFAGKWSIKIRPHQL